MGNHSLKEQNLTLINLFHLINFFAFIVQAHTHYSTIIFMKITPASTSIATHIKQSLLKRALATISKRQLLYKNMNLYSLDQLTKIIQQVNQQQALTINSTLIPQTNDHTTHPYDNMMSMSEVKLMPASTGITEHHPSQVQNKHNHTESKWHAAHHNKDKNSIVNLLEEDSTSRDYLTTCYLVGKQQKIEESAEIQAFRQMKVNEQQALLIKRQSQQKKRQIPINLNNQRVMYGYDSKVIKLQKMKEKHPYHISQISSSLINLDETQTKIKISTLNKAIPIKNKINITQKQAQEQRSRQLQKQRRIKRTYKSSTIQEAPTITICVNPQSHKQIEQAIAIKQPGVKISFDKRQYQADRYTTQRMNRKLTRSEYLQIKSNQHVKQAYFRQHNQNKTDKVKIRPEDRLKTQYVKEEKSSAQFSSDKKYKISLSTFYNYPKKEKSTIFTHSLQAKAQLLKQAKDKPFLFQTIIQSKSLQKQQSLSSVDKYNLLYQRYKGNPPQNLLSQLQSQSKLLRQPKPALLSFSKSMIRENKLIRKTG